MRQAVMKEAVTTRNEVTLKHVSTDACTETALPAVIAPVEEQQTVIRALVKAHVQPRGFEVFVFVRAQYDTQLVSADSRLCSKLRPLYFSIPLPSLQASQMEPVLAHDWTAWELSELVAFFSWLDALCAEAMRQGQKAPWPNSDRITEELNSWMIDFGRGLTPAQALNNYYSIECSGRVESGRAAV